MASQSLIQISDFLDSHDIVFEPPPPDRLKCTICKLILKNAKQTSCGCKVCEKCITNYLRDGEKSCPSSNSECADSKLMLNRDINQDNATNKEISNLKAKCPFKLCGAVDMLRNMMGHVTICEYREESCVNCDKKYPVRDKATHDKNECDGRRLECPHCGETMSAGKLSKEHLNDEHDGLCSKYIGKCPNGCGLQSTYLKEHLAKCLNKKEDCPFSPDYCKGAKYTKEKLRTHLEEESASHFRAVLLELTKLKEANTKLTAESARLQQIVKEQMAITEKLTESRLKMERTVDDLKKKSPGATSSDKSVLFRNGSFIWRIADFEALKTDAETGGRASVTSDPFYTSEFGYKMCLRIYPAGDGVGRGNHLSVFFAIMKGDFDDLLSWPFKQKVTLSLLDQENSAIKNHSDTFKPDARSACYQKPIDDCNIASGSPKFIALPSLLPTSIYYKNDTIFLKISVDTIGISKP